MKIRELLDAPNSAEVGNALSKWARELRDRILRGDMMIGILPEEEVKLAARALRKAYECGNKTALIDLGNWLASPPHGAPDLDGARAAFREAIAVGVAGAKLRFTQFIWFYCRETASPEEKREVYLFVEDLSHGSEEDSAEALYMLGLFTNAGFGTPVNQPKACEIQMKAAAAGNADAMFEAFLYHEMGIGVAKDSQTARHYLKQAAENGHGRAMYNLAVHFATGDGMPQDMVKAAEWYSRSSDAGNVRATANLAMMYAKGQGVEQDLHRAEMLFDEAEYVGLDCGKARASVGL